MAGSCARASAPDKFPISIKRRVSPAAEAMAFANRIRQVSPVVQAMGFAGFGVLRRGFSSI
jgi:hypothetical protein